MQRDVVRMAMGGVAANKLRSLLTVLGVLIGVSAVIILVAVGTGSSQAVEQRIESLGTNTLTVINTGRFGAGRSVTGTQSRAATLTIADVQKISNPNTAPDVASVSPVLSTSLTATYQGATYSTTVTGSTPSYLKASDYTVASGRAITSADIARHAQVVDIGASVASNLFATGSNPIGQQITLGSTNWLVVGLLASKGSSAGANQDAVAIAPYTAVQDQLTGESQSFTELLVQAKSSSTINLAQSEVENILAAQNDTTVANLPFLVLNEASLLSTATSTTSTLTVLLGAVAAISLLVGGIGVMNIMLVSVTERTREIGIRKAIGARKLAILLQFLIEAVMISLIGGAVGVAIGLIGARFKIDGVQPVVAPDSIALAFGVAIAVGVFFGFYPANRAASLRPIDALHYE
ncbi:MAG TPA: ABC transporter permease [Acidimicrobiales bacterium]|nr:ABC transporter permease [Acidimicrobiales bacterium]